MTDSVEVVKEPQFESRVISYSICRYVNNLVLFIIV